MKRTIIITFFLLITFFRFDVFGMIVSIKPDGLPAEKVNFIFRSSGNVESIVVTSPDGIIYEAQNNTDNKIIIYMENAPAGNYKIDIRGDFTTFSVSIVSKTTSVDSQPESTETNKNQISETTQIIASKIISETNETISKTEKQTEKQITTEPKQTTSLPGETTMNTHRETAAGVAITPNTANTQNQPVKQNNAEIKENKLTEKAATETNAENRISSENYLQETDIIDTTFIQEITTETAGSEWIPVITIPETGLWYGNMDEENEMILKNTGSSSEEDFNYSENEPMNLKKKFEFKPDFSFRIFSSFILYFSVSCFLGAGICRKKSGHIFRCKSVIERE